MKIFNFEKKLIIPICGFIQFTLNLLYPLESEKAICIFI